MGTSSSLRLFFPGGTKGENRGERNPPPLAASIADAIAPQTLDGVGREELFGFKRGSRGATYGCRALSRR